MSANANPPRWLNGEPYYCAVCGAGLGEYHGCEMPDCRLETKAEAEKRSALELANPSSTPNATQPDTGSFRLKVRVTWARVLYGDSKLPIQQLVEDAYGKNFTLRVMSARALRALGLEPTP